MENRSLAEHLGSYPQPRDASPCPPLTFLSNDPEFSRLANELLLTRPALPRTGDRAKRGLRCWWLVVDVRKEHLNDSKSFDPVVAAVPASGLCAILAAARMVGFAGWADIFAGATG